MFPTVITKEDFRQIAKRLLLTAVLLLALIAIGLIVSAVSAQRADKQFAQAADFPRGALVYAQFKDLPALLKQWNESPVKNRFLGSVNRNSSRPAKRTSTPGACQPPRRIRSTSKSKLSRCV